MNAFPFIVVSIIPQLTGFICLKHRATFIGENLHMGCLQLTYAFTLCSEMRVCDPLDHGFTEMHSLSNLF